MGWFRRKQADSLDPQYLLAQANAEADAQADAEADAQADAEADAEADADAALTRADTGPQADAEGRARTPPPAPFGFRLTVEDVFTIRDRGTVITGRIESGTIKVGDVVRQTRVDGTSRDVTVTGIEMFRKVLDTAAAGENVGLLLRELARADIGRGDVLTR